MTFTKSFLNALIFNIATIVAIVVGVVGYVVRAARVWYANGGKEVIIKLAANFTAGVHKVTEKIYYTLEDAELA